MNFPAKIAFFRIFFLELLSWRILIQSSKEKEIQRYLQKLLDKYIFLQKISKYRLHKHFYRFLSSEKHLLMQSLLQKVLNYETIQQRPLFEEIIGIL